MVPPPNVGLALISPPTVPDISSLAGSNPDSTKQHAAIKSSLGMPDKPRYFTSQPVAECFENSSHSPATSIGSGIASTTLPIVDASVILPTTMTHPVLALPQTMLWLPNAREQSSAFPPLYYLAALRHRLPPYWPRTRTPALVTHLLGIHILTQTFISLMSRAFGQGESDSPQGTPSFPRISCSAVI
jgi:hypothetical protein